jgi:hypothetical protein
MIQSRTLVFEQPRAQDNGISTSGGTNSAWPRPISGIAHGCTGRSPQRNRILPLCQELGQELSPILTTYRGEQNQRCAHEGSGSHVMTLQHAPVRYEEGFCGLQVSSTWDHCEPAVAELLLICSFIFFFISWGVGSAICVAIIQVYPSGSTTVPQRSPQNISMTGP